MIVTINSQVLAAELRLLTKIVPTKPAIAVLECVVFRADLGLTMQATDLEISLTSTVDVPVEQPGAAAIPAGKLLQLVERFPDGDVRLSQEGNKCHVQCGAFRSRLQAFNVADFPMVNSNAATGAPIMLHQLLERTRYATTQRQAVLNGALLILKGGAAMVATDGHRLSIATAPYSGAELRAVVPSKALDALLLLEDPVACADDGRGLSFTSGNRTLTSRKIEGEYPAYERIVPRDADKKIIIERHALTAALYRAGVMSEVNFAVYLAFAENTITVTSSSAQVGDASEHLACQYDGPPLKLCVNWKYVVDFLDAASGHVVTIAVKSEKTPALWSDGESFINVVMPMRAS